MASRVTASIKFQDIAITGNVSKAIVEEKQTTKLCEHKVTVSKSKSVNVKMQSGEVQKRSPLKEVVTDCTKRWFQESLKEAKSGDVGLQILVGQMYCSGYGIPPDIKKGKSWFQKASKSRSKILSLCAKPPGYSRSDSDSDNQENEQK
ncbi:hypothetical protein SUGI_0536660 [Cryptomeria japonica]|uniref:uncharacterized protein LOC131039539 n=1 Tax=Cryptomeria japonica TaxID=3369 RepID=UPI002408C390|nr:uncharacterized protein LOC131039539 [Cryptomeria japonica]XP_057828307.2 uncharacterized protein LOC131039539 [Cryptomeria japonica]GLJ27345.1 hypothetical protein SUGI_0536660 [Cryptomeria japonica]